jgi:hypothetical protein
MEATNGRRVPFSVLATTTPKLLYDVGSRQYLLIFNNTSGNIYLGASGTGANGLIIPPNTAFHDLFSSDAWWVSTPSSSGTVSGFAVI